MNAEAIARALEGRKAGRTWMARCPAHEDREPSLSIVDARGGKVLVRCHAGCDQPDVIAALRLRGLWGERGYSRFTRPAPRAGGTNRAGWDEGSRTEAALVIWKAAIPARGTPVEAYLASRGLHLPPVPSLRFHDGLKHPSGDLWPAMVALVTRASDDTPLAIHRTFLARDGVGKAPIDPQKMMLGPCSGGAVRLGNARDTLLVGEGVETVLAAVQATGVPGWAALSTSGLRTLDLPTEAREIVIMADGDDAGEAAAQHAAERWTHKGRQVRIARPPLGMDFNDLLRAGP
jgi:putative DNA primase/helicase